MREIKFRAWDGEEIAYSEDQRCFNCDGWEQLGEFFKHYFGCEMMQYTGLKDKNGKEIYEDDVVKIEHAIARGDGQYDEAVCLVRFRGSSFMCCYEHLYYVNTDCEVIGNIHENPELID